MWAVITENGDVIMESDCLWPELSPDVRIKELRYRARNGEVGKIEGFEAYGFQRYSLSVPGGAHIPHAGTQLIGVKDQEVTIIDIDEVNGRVTSTRLSRDELTYNPKLLRHGNGR